MENYLTDAPKEVWLRQGDDRNQIVIHAKARDAVAGRVRLKGVSLFVYQKNKDGLPEFKRRLEAAEAELLPVLAETRSIGEHLEATYAKLEPHFAALGQGPT